MQSLDRTAWIVELTNISSATFLVYDTVLTLGDEVNHIWDNFGRSWIRWHYVLIRYLTLLHVLARVSIQTAIMYGHIKSLTTMKAWLFTQTVSGNLLIVLVQIVLMTRVYALYEQNKYLRWLFSLLVLTECLTTVLNVTLTIRRDLNHENIFGPTPRLFVVFGVVPSLTQFSVLILTLLKYRGATREGWANKTPIIPMMIRDGTIAFILLFAMTAGWVVGTVTHSRYTPIFYFWLISIGASTGCRLIINTNKLKPGIRLPTRSTRNSTLFTTFTTENDPEACTTLGFSRYS